MSHLAVFLFGPPRLERDGETINVDTRKAIALLAYLAITGQRHSRDALAALLWPDYDQSHARATLRRTLSALNKALAGNWLSIDRETVRLAPGASFWLDIDEFNRHLASCLTHGHSTSEVCPACLEPLTQATRLYRDDFMAGFNLHDSSTFDDWQFFQADGFRRELANVLERLVLCHSTLANFSMAITQARRWLALDRLHEPAYRCLMQLYAWSGQRTAALQQYQECVHMLDQELGVAPLEATTQLYQAIKQNQGPPPPTPVRTLTATTKNEQVRRITASLSHASDTIVSPSQPSPTRYPLIGRHKEWSMMQKAYANAATSGHVIVLEGETGIGKTRLAQELLTSARNKAAAVFVTRCYEGETTLAYTPFVTGLRLRMAVVEKLGIQWQDQIAAHWLSEAARLLPELSRLCPDLPPAPPLDSPGAQAHFFEGLRQFLLALCPAGQNAPASILFIDDVHWADAASLDFLSYLVRRLHEHPLCILLTWRTAQKDHRLHQLLVTAHRAGQATQLPLTRLEQETVKQLVQAATTSGMTTTNGLAERLYQETEGLPLFLTEYLTAITYGMLETDNNHWSLPGDVRALLTSRISAVGETSRQLLSTAAVIGRSFDFDTLHEASGRSEEETVIALEELVNHGLVVEIRGQQKPTLPPPEADSPEQSDNIEQLILIYDFSHEKLRSLVYESTSLARRRLLHRRIAEILAAYMRRQRRGEARAGKIAYHYQIAGNVPEAAYYYFRAGEHARALYAYNEALAHFHSALSAGYPNLAKLHEAIGDLHTLLGIYSMAITHYKTAATHCDGFALTTIQRKLGIVHGRRGEWEQAEYYYADALQILGETGPVAARSEIYADWSLTAYRRRQNAQAQELAQHALHLAEIAQDMRALAQAHNMLGILANSRQHLAQANHHLEQSLALAENLHDSSIRVAALNNLALAYKASGAIEQAINLTRSALTLSIAHGYRHREAALHNNLADLLYTKGHLKDAMYHLKRAVSIYAEIGVEAGTVQPEIWKLTEW